MEAQPEALNAKLDVAVDIVVDGRPIHIEVRVIGEGEAAQHTVRVLSEAIATVIAPPAESPAIAQAIPATPPIKPGESRTGPPAMLWVQRNRARINVGFGALLVALALLIPLIVPPAQRSDVLILTILFTLAGALLLFTAFLPGRSRMAAPMDAPAAPKQTPAPDVVSAASAERRTKLLQPVQQHAAIRAGAGLALSLVFIVVGLVAPFLLGAANADERFLIMLGFVPITVVGFFMLAVFGRRIFDKLLPAGVGTAAMHSKSAPAARRAPVSRVPQNFEYRAVVPVAIVSALILMVVVVGVVIYGTVASIAR